jgi:hypothetical protein
VCEIATEREADQRRSSGRSGPWKVGTKGTRFRKSVEWKVAKLFPWLTRLQIKDPVAAAAHDSDRGIFVRLIQLPARKKKGADGAVLENEETSRRVFGAVRQCFKQGGEGCLDDERIFTKSWGFKLKDVPFEKVRL